MWDISIFCLDIQTSIDLLSYHMSSKRGGWLWTQRPVCLEFNPTLSSSMECAVKERQLMGEMDPSPVPQGCKFMEMEC